MLSATFCRRLHILLSITTFLLASSAPAAEETSKTLDVKGSFRIRAETGDRTDYIGTRAFSTLRVRPMFTFHASDEAVVYFEPQFAKSFGEINYPGTGAATNAAQQTSGTTYDTALGVHQAYADYSPVTWGKLLAGRQVLSYGDELVIGALDWNNVGRSFDAFRARSKYDLGFTDVFTSKLVDTNTAAPSDGDYDLHGVYNSWKFGEFAKETDFYVLYLVDGRGTGPAPLKLWTAGARVKTSLETTDYRAEVTGQSGTASGSKLSGFQGDAEGGYTFDSAKKTRLGVGGFLATKNYNQLFPTSHKWLGYADILGRRNIVGAVARFSAKPAKEWTLSFDAHQFFRASKTDPVYKLNGTTALGTGGGSSKNDVGTEADLTAKFEAAQNVVLTGGASVLVPGGYLRDQFGSRLPLFYYAQMEIRF